MTIQRTVQSRLNSIRRDAVRRGIEFHLTYSEVESLIQGNCFWCGCRPWKYYAKNTCPTNGIDRVNSDLEYTLDNCVSCCMNCNKLKGSLQAKDFLNFVQAVAMHQRNSRVIGLINSVT